MSLPNNLNRFGKTGLPYYCEVEYLQSNGSQWIDTGVLGDVGQTLNINMQYTNLTNPEQIMGKSWYDNGGFSIGYAKNASETKMIAQAGHTLLYAGTLDLNRHSCSLTINSSNLATFTVDGDTSTSAITFTQSQGTMTLFARRNNPIDNSCSAKLYSCSIMEGSNYIRYFIPVLDLNMTPCLYDKVTNQLFYNQGTGNFVAGRQIHPVEYLEADGNKFIKTGIVPNNSTGAYCVFNLNNITNNNYILGSRGSQLGVGRFYLYNNESSTKVRYGWGSLNTTDADTIIGTKVSVSLNYKNDKKYIYNNSILVQSLSDVSWSSNTYQMYLFSSNFAGDDSISIWSGINGKIYEAKITEGSDIVRDFIPAIDENGVGFMFDRVTHTIFDNAGTGNFIPG